MITNYAGSLNLATDAVVLARVNKSARATSQKKYVATLLYGEFEPDSLYLLDETLLRQVAMTIDVESDLLAQIDGFYVVAPGWKKCATCPTDAAIFLPLGAERASMILVEAKPLLSTSHPKQVVEAKINGIPTNLVILTAGSGGKFNVVIPTEVKEQLKHNPLLKLQLHFPDAARPVDIGINSDRRKLAIGLVALTVQ